MNSVNPYSNLNYPQEGSHFPAQMDQAVKAIKSDPQRREALRRYFDAYQGNDRFNFTKLLQHELHGQRVHPELMECLHDLVWPSRATDKADYEKLLAGRTVTQEELAFAKFETEKEYKYALLKKYEEVVFHRLGIVPSWVMIKRDTPNAQAFMIKEQTHSYPALGFIRGDSTVEGYPHPYKKKMEIDEASGFQGEEYLSNPTLIGISEYLTTKNAHGDFRYVAGLQKGGLPGILDICVDGALYTPWVGTMSLNVGRDISQGRHGPWYAILVEGFDESKKPYGRSLEVQLNMMETFLVPHIEDKNYLLNALRNAMELKLIEPSRFEELSRKIMTYEEAKNLYSV